MWALELLELTEVILFWSPIPLDPLAVVWWLLLGDEEKLLWPSFEADKMLVFLSSLWFENWTNTCRPLIVGWRAELFESCQ